MFDLDAMQDADEHLKRVVERVIYVTQSAEATVYCAKARIEQSQERMKRTWQMTRVRVSDPQDAHQT